MPPWLVVARALGVLLCVTLTGLAVLVPEHPALQLLASAACAGFAWVFGLPPGVMLGALLARMRPERLAAAVQRATSSMPPAQAAQVMESLRPPPAAGAGSVPPVPIVFEGDAADGWEEPPAGLTPAKRPPRRH